MMKNSLEISTAWWHAWQNQSVNRQILAAMITVGGLTALAKLTALVKEAIIAHHFGTSDALDAFLIAWLLPQLAVNVIGGALNSALIPTFVQVREQEGEIAALTVFSIVMVLSSVFLTILSIILALSAPTILPYLAAGFGVDKLTLTTSLHYILLSTVVLGGIATTLSAVLNAGNRFALAAAVPIMTSIVTVALILVLADEWGIYSLAAGTASGALVEAAVLACGLLRQGIPLIPHSFRISPALTRVLKQFAPAMAGNFLASGTVVVSQSMAAMLNPGSVSALAYGSKVTNVMLGVGALTVSTAVFPHFSRMVTMKDWDGLRHTLSTYVRLLLVFTLPATLMLMYFSKTIVALLFQRGAFTEADTQLVTWVQTMYLLQIPSFVLIMLLVRLISSFHANHLLVRSAFINLSGTIVCTYLFMQWLDVIGIALATSVSYLFSCGYLVLACMRLMKSAEPMNTDSASFPSSSHPSSRLQDA